MSTQLIKFKTNTETQKYFTIYLCLRFFIIYPCSYQTLKLLKMSYLCIKYRWYSYDLNSKYHLLDDARVQDGRGSFSLDFINESLLIAVSWFSWMKGTDDYGLDMKCPPHANMLSTWSLTGSAILRIGGNFRRWDLDGRSGSFPSLSLPPVFCQVSSLCHVLLPYNPLPQHGPRDNGASYGRMRY
jgi:hypothetical protein